MIEIAIVVAVLSGGVVALRALSLRGGDREGDEIWTTAARRVDGEVELIPSSFLTTAQRKIRLTVEGIPVCVETLIDTDRQTNVKYTRVSTGTLSVPYGARLQVQPRDLVRLISKRLGIGELPTGDATFDDAYHVSGVPRALVLAFLDAQTRQLVASAGTGFEIADDILVVRREGEPSEVGPLVGMTRFAIELVERWTELARGPQALAESLGLALDSRLTLPSLDTSRVATGVHRTRPVVLSVRLGGEQALTVLSFEQRGMHDWAMERDENDAFTHAGGPPDAARVYVRSAPASLLGARCVAEKVEIVFDGLAPDHDEVAESLDALLDATAPLTPYR